mgnify:CR=1 FL=1
MTRTIARLVIAGIWAALTSLPAFGQIAFVTPLAGVPLTSNSPTFWYKPDANYTGTTTFTFSEFEIATGNTNSITCQLS